MNRSQKTLPSLLLAAAALVGAGSSRPALAQEDYREALSMPARSVSVQEQRSAVDAARHAAVPSPVVGYAPLAAEAQALADASFVYYVPASAHAGGAFGSFWVSDLLGRNPNSMTGPAATVSVIAHPRGQVMSSTDPAIPVFTVPGGASFDFLDVLDRVRYADGSGFSGAAWLEIRSDQPLSSGDVPTYNLPATGERTGSTIAPFDTRSLMTNPRFAHEGDTIEVRLMGSRQNFRENEITFVPPESGDVTMLYEHLDLLGNRKALATMDVPAGSYQQQVLEALTGQAVLPGDTIRKTVTRKNGSDPSKELLAYSIISQVHTLNPQFQDSAALEGTRYPLAEVTFSSPLDGEQNDPVTFSARINVPGGYAASCGFHEYGVPTAQQYGEFNTNKTNPWSLTHNTVLGTPGTNTPALICGIIGGFDGRVWNRRWENPSQTTKAEDNSHLVTLDDAARARFIQHLPEIAALLAKGYVADVGDSSKAYLTSQSEWTALLTPRLDGSVANEELTGVTMHRTPRAIQLNNWFNSTHSVVPVNGFDKPDQLRLHYLLTGKAHW